MKVLLTAKLLKNLDTSQRSKLEERKYREKLAEKLQTETIILASH